MKAGALNPHTGRDFVQFGKTESVLNKGAEKIALLFNPPPVLSLEIILLLGKCGHTDMRKSIDGLMAIIRDTYEMEPYSNSLFLFCGRRCDRIKALHFEKDGFCLLYKRLDNGRFQWPRNSSQVRNLTRQEYRWLLEGLSIAQPKAIRPVDKKAF